MQYCSGRFFRIHKRTLLTLAFLGAFSLTVVYATPPTSPYTPGQTLDPSCAPGDTNCTVQLLTLQTNSTNNGNQQLLNLAAGSGVTLSDNGSGTVTIAATGGGGSALTLQTNGTNNGSQALLNLIAGNNVTLTDNGSGGVTIAATGGGGGSGTVTSFSAGNLSPLFTTSVTNASSTPSLSFTLSSAGANTIFGNNTGSSATPAYNSASTYADALLGLSGTGLVKRTGTNTYAIASAGTDYQAPITLTTTGTSGPATFSSNTLNIPQYAGTTYTASNGLTMTSNNVALGGSLTGNTSITGGANSLSVSSTGSTTLNVTSSAASGTTALNVSSTGTTNGITAAVTAVDTSAALPILVKLTTASGSSLADVKTILNVERGSNVTTADGFGASIDYALQSPLNSAGTYTTSNSLISKFTNTGSTSQFLITGYNSSSTSTLLTLLGNGALQLNHYGSGTFTGTATYNLAVDSSGNIIEVATGGGGGTPDLQAVTDQGYFTSNPIESAGSGAQTVGTFNAAGTTGVALGYNLPDETNKPAVQYEKNGDLLGDLLADNVTNTGGVSPNREWQLPDASGTLALGVTDGTSTVYAGTNGVIDISSLLTGGGGGGSPSRFGVSGEDDTTTQDRNFDLNTHELDISASDGTYSTELIDAAQVLNLNTFDTNGYSSELFVGQNGSANSSLTEFDSTNQNGSNDTQAYIATDADNLDIPSDAGSNPLIPFVGRAGSLVAGFDIANSLGSALIAETNGTLDLFSSTNQYNLNGVTYALPSADGTNGQVLSTDGSGNLTWTTVSGGGGGSSRFGVSGEDDTASEDRSFDLGTHTFQIGGEDGGLNSAFNLSSNEVDLSSSDDNYDTELFMGQNADNDQSFFGALSSNSLSNTTAYVIADSENLDMGTQAPFVSGKAGSALVGYDTTNSFTSALVAETNGTLDLYSSTNAYNLNGITYALPSADGTSGQVLTTNGSGTLSWADAGGGGGSSRFGVSGEDDTATQNRTFNDSTYSFEITQDDGSHNTDFDLQNSFYAATADDSGNYGGQLFTESNANGNFSQAGLASYNNSGVQTFAQVYADSDDLDMSQPFLSVLSGKAGSAMVGADQTNSLSAAVITETNGTVDLYSSTNTYNLNGVTYALPTAQAAGAGYVLTNNGSGVLSWTNVSGGSSGLTLETNGTVNGDQTILNLVAGSGIALTDDGVGNVTVAANGGGDVIHTNASYIGITSGIDSAGAAPTFGDSNMIGDSAGSGASGAYGSNFFGNAAGSSATNADDSNFLGSAAGSGATNASHSNFFGQQAGEGATGASNSNFIGNFAGHSATNASYSNLFGYNVGNNPGSDNIGSNNIIIGTNISLSNATSDAINIGGVLFGTGTQNDTISGSPHVTAQTAGKIGIATIPTTYTLEVGNSSISGAVAQFTNSTGSCTINPTTTSLSCSSDQTLKKNITSLDTSSTTTNSNGTSTPPDTILNELLSLRPVTYNWNSESDTTPPHTGFIAQEVQQVFPDLVAQDPTTHLYSLNYIGLVPYTIRALQELDVQVQSLSMLTPGATTPTLGDRLIAWFADVGNGIKQLFAKEIDTQNLCITDTSGNKTCITKTQLDQLIQNASHGTTTVTTSTTSTTSSDDASVDNASDTASGDQSVGQLLDQSDTSVENSSSTYQSFDQSSDSSGVLSEPAVTDESTTTPSGSDTPSAPSSSSADAAAPAPDASADQSH